MTEQSRLHHAVIEHVIRHGFAPEPSELAGILGAPVPAVERGLRTLEDGHGVVLHPGTSRIWVIHPFSLAPTNFLVRAGAREWWAPCAWCALGVAALVARDVEIVTTLGATSDQVTISIRDGALVDARYVVHFPVPMRAAWDNVIYTCSTMLMFSDQADVERWSGTHRIPMGDVQPIATVWELAKAWYGKHRDPDWRKWTVDEARRIFSRLGLDGAIWDLPDADERF